MSRDRDYHSRRHSSDGYRDYPSVTTELAINTLVIGSAKARVALANDALGFPILRTRLDLLGGTRVPKILIAKLFFNDAPIRVGGSEQEATGPAVWTDNGALQWKPVDGKLTQSFWPIPWQGSIAGVHFGPHLEGLPVAFQIYNGILNLRTRASLEFTYSLTPKFAAQAGNGQFSIRLTDGQAELSVTAKKVRQLPLMDGSGSVFRLGVN